MERLRLRPGKASPKADEPVVLPIERRRGKGRLRTVIAGFILSFLMLCAVLAVQRLFEKGPVLAEWLGNFLVEQGMTVPETETWTPNSIN